LQALKKEKEKAASSNGVPAVADNTEGTSTQPAQNTTKDSSTLEGNDPTPAAVEAVPVNDKEEIVNKDKPSTDFATDKNTVSCTEEQPGKDGTTCQDVKESSQQDTISQDISTQQEATQPEVVEDKDNSQSAAEVSMEVDELVVHTIDEDDFKIEEQSRSKVSKRKSGELPAGGVEERVS